MKKALGIIGASGHGKVLVDIALACGINDIVFFDDDISKIGLTHYGFPVFGPLSKIGYEVCERYIVGVGDNATRCRIQRQLEACGCCLTNLVHPAACISPSAVMGNGVAIMPGAIVNACARVGDGCILNTGSTVDHDCKIGDFCHLSPGAHLAGSVEFGNLVWSGIGSSVINGIRVVSESIIGAGAVVVSDIAVSGTYVGVPAKQLLISRR